MTEYVKLRRGVGIELPDGSTMSSRYAHELLCALQQGKNYVIYRQRHSVKGFPFRKVPGRSSALRKELDKPPPKAYSKHWNMAERRLDYETAVVLRAIANGYEYALEIAPMVGLALATVYHKLGKLEDAQLIHVGREPQEIVAREKRRPRARYEITRNGRTALKEIGERHPVLSMLLPHVPKKTEPKPVIAGTGRKQP